MVFKDLILKMFRWLIVHLYLQNKDLKITELNTLIKNQNLEIMPIIMKCSDNIKIK
jgi:hypothetical protein